MVLCRLLVVPALAACVLAKRVELNWNITYTMANPDGENTRQVIGVNNKWPIPPVEVDLGDNLVINAFNYLDEPTSLHVHGFFQNGTTYYDGAASVTECGIPPGGSYTYDMNVTQTGTYWIHSHFMAQYLDGLRLPLISHPPKEVYEYDEDIPMMLEAWYHRPSKDIHDQLLSTSQDTRESPFRPYMLVNSQGGVDLGKTTLRFTPGKTYRLRLINVSGTGMIRFGIEDHTMKVIEVDGVDTEPKQVNSVQLSVGQRTSVLVTAKPTDAHNYIYHSDIFTDIQSGVARATLPFSSIVEYNPQAPLLNDTTKSTVDWEFFQDIDLVPIEKIPIPGVHKWVPLDVHTSIFDDRREHLAFNNRTYEMPLVPTLTTALTSGYQAFYPDVYGFKSYPVILDPMSDIEVAIFNRDINSHPFHLHGHNFFIFRRGPIDGAPEDILTGNASHPIRRDTITLPPESYAIVRFRADNPGVWLFHCHMQFHHEQGLALTFIESPYGISKNIKPPEQYEHNCRKLGIPTAGNAMGRMGLDLPNESRGPFPLTGF